MELDDLKRSWDAHAKDIEASIRLSTRALREVVLGKAESALQRLRRLLCIEVAITIIPALWLARYLFLDATAARFVVSALVLEVGVAALIVVGVRQIVAISRVDYAAPVVLMQRQLESLRVERIRATKWTLLLAPLAWTPALIVVLDGFLRFDVSVAFGAAWVASNVAVGAAVLIGGIWLAKRYAARIDTSPMMRGLARDFAGHNLTAAAGFLHSLDDLEDGHT